MIRSLIGVGLALALAGCVRHRDGEARALAIPPVRAAATPSDVDYLAAHPAILADVHRRCKARTMDATPELCAAAAEATRRRFLRVSGSYAPQPVRPFAADRAN